MGEVHVAVVVVEILETSAIEELGEAHIDWLVEQLRHCVPEGCSR